MNVEELRFDGEGSSALIIRHAERRDMASLSESLRTRLTEKGKRDAFEMGKAIRGVDRLRLFHSPAARCNETAKEIAKGFLSTGGEVLGSKETWDLCAPYLLDDEIIAVADRQGNGFMRSWFNGHLNAEWIKPPAEAADMVLTPILAGLGEGGEGRRLDIHVSHDWELVLLKEELLGLRYEEAGWVEYLEGIRFDRQGNGFTMQNRGRSTHFMFSNGRRVVNQH